MQVQVNTDNNIRGTDDLVNDVKQRLSSALERFPAITRVEVYLRRLDVSRGGSATDQCVLEARVAGRRPVTARDQADTLQAAVSGASQKLIRVLEKDQLKH